MGERTISIDAKRWAASLERKEGQEKGKKIVVGDFGIPVL